MKYIHQYYLLNYINKHRVSFMYEHKKFKLQTKILFHNFYKNNPELFNEIMENPNKFEYNKSILYPKNLRFPLHKILKKS